MHTQPGTTKYEVDERIEHAKTLSTDFYLNPNAYEIAKEKIFSKTWQFSGDSAMLGPKHAMPVLFQPGLLDEPLLLSSDAAGKIHNLSNVCTHRGNLLIEKNCKVNDLRCKYHGRRFKLDGTFLSMPEFTEVKNFPTPEDNLTALPLHQWSQFLFTGLPGALPAELFFKEMSERIGWMELDKYKFRADLSRDFHVEAHWALYCENYLEGFHIPFVHAGLNSVIDYGSYTTELFRYSNLQLAIAKDSDAYFDLPETSPDYGKKVAAYYFWVFPNMMFNFYPWGLSVNIVRPTGTTACTVSFLTYVFDESKRSSGAGADLLQVEMEDEDVVQLVQRGIKSRFYKHGRYSVTRETGTHHFHRLVAGFMN